jgi:hypothetical protein
MLKVEYGFESEIHVTRRAWTLEKEKDEVDKLLEHVDEVDRDADLAKLGVGAVQLLAEAARESGPGSASAAHAASGSAEIKSLDVDGSGERQGDTAAERLLEGGHVESGDDGKDGGKMILVEGPDGGPSAVNIEQQLPVSLSPPGSSRRRCSCFPFCSKKPRHPKKSTQKHKVSNRSTSRHLVCRPFSVSFPELGF